MIGLNRRARCYPIGSDYVMSEKREMKNVPATEWAYKEGDGLNSYI